MKRCACRRADHPAGTKLVRRFISGRGWFVIHGRLQRKGEQVEYRKLYEALTGHGPMR